MVGSELNIYAAEEAKRSGHDVKQEVDVPGTKVDVLLDNEHAIECKAVSKLRPKVITQIRKYKGRYKHVSVLILADTRVSAHIKEQLDREGADIIRAEIDREGLLDRLLQVQRVIH
jgi:phosphopantothenoylcysteine synthetase/decarboxylase